MKFEEFVGQVQARARLADANHALAAIRATLETLAERLTGGEPKDIASQLPSEIARFLTHATSANGERFSLEEFLRRVSIRENIELRHATYHARVVLEVLAEAISRGEMDDLKSQLPAEFNPLFDAGSHGQMRTA